jgi:tRNA (guanine6-N2)-methyltransferase
VDYYAHTLPGFEQIAWLEIRARLPRVIHRGNAFAEEKNGIVFFTYAIGISDVLALRSVEDVFAVAAQNDKLSRDYGDLRTIARQLADEDGVERAVQMWMSVNTPARGISARVVSRKTGEHAYRRMDVEDAARKALAGRYKSALRWVEDDAALEFWVNVLGSKLVVGVRLSDRAMRHRDYKVAHLEASLRPSAAAALSVLAAAPSGGVVLDPTCGAGTLLAEALALDPTVRAIGGDIAAHAVRAARKNGARSVLRWDAGRLPLAAGSVDAIVCNPPFGKKIGDRGSVGALYPRLAAETARVLKPGARAVFITSAYDAFRDALRGAPGLRLDRGYAVAVLGEWGRVYVLSARLA